MNQGIAIILEEDKGDLIPDDSDASGMLNEIIIKMRENNRRKLVAMADCFRAAMTSAVDALESYENNELEMKTAAGVRFRSTADRTEVHNEHVDNRANIDTVEGHNADQSNSADKSCDDETEDPVENTPWQMDTRGYLFMDREKYTGDKYVTSSESQKFDSCTRSLNDLVQSTAIFIFFLIIMFCKFLL